MDTTDMEDRIRQILRENSGGCKIMELIPALVPTLVEHATSTTDLVDEIFAVISSMPDVGILEYVHRLSESMVRVKEFVYFKP